MLSLQTAIFTVSYLVRHHLKLTHTGDGVWSLVDFVHGIVACTEQGEAVVFQTENVYTLEGVDNLRIVDGMSCKAITGDIGAAEAFGV